MENNKLKGVIHAYTSDDCVEDIKSNVASESMVSDISIETNFIVGESRTTVVTFSLNSVCCVENMLERFRKFSGGRNYVTTLALYINNKAIPINMLK